MTDAAAKRRFALHYVEMVAAMGIGMGVFWPLWHLILDDAAMDRTDVMAMTMATNMVIGMSLWMWVRGHTFAPIAEMALAMYLPFVVLLIPLWLGVISSAFLMIAGHVLMLGTMLLAMLYRKDEYTCHHGFRWAKSKSEPSSESRG